MEKLLPREWPKAGMYNSYPEVIFKRALKNTVSDIYYYCIFNSLLASILQQTMKSFEVLNLFAYGDIFLINHWNVIINYFFLYLLR